MTTRRFLLLVSAGLALGLGGCTRDSGTVVARVGKMVLTREELESMVPPDFARFAGREVYVDLVRRWIQIQLLAQEARQRDLHKDPELRRLLEQRQDEILAQGFLDRQLDSVPEPDEARIRKFYDEHQDQFVRREPEVAFAQIRLPDQALAVALRAKLTPATFAAEAARVNPEQASRPQSQRLYRRAELSPAVAEMVFALKEGEISPPVQTEEGWCVYHLVSRAPAGSLRPLQAVSDQILVQLREAQRQERIQALVADLRRNSRVELVEARLPGVKSPAVPAPSAVAPVVSKATVAPDTSMSKDTGKKSSKP